MERSPVDWDPYLHACVVTGYEEALTVLLKFSADRTATPAQLDELGLSSLAPIAALMTRQMLFIDSPRSHASSRPNSAGESHDHSKITVESFVREPHD